MWLFKLTSFIILLNSIGAQSPIVSSDKPLSLPKAISNFATRFYEQIAKVNSGDLIASPFSVFSALCLLSQGADGDTYQQLVNGLNMNNDKAIVADEFQNINQKLHQDAGSAEMSIANQIYVMVDYELNQTFQDVANEKFQSHVETLNFTNADSSAQTINSFVKKITKNQITDVVSPSMFDARTRVVLINAIYFKGKWLHAFDPKKTKVGQFQTDAKSSVPIQFMNTINTFNYAEFDDLNAKALEMPYNSSKLSFVILLPNDQMGLKTLQESVMDIDWTTSLGQMRSQKVNATIPKFKAHFQLSLNDILKTMNMGAMFSSSANLSRILNSTEPLSVSEVHHSSTIEIDENGATAASATSIVNRVSRPAPPIEPIIMQFNADHAFIFFIVDKAENAIIFNGQLGNPITG